jgi:hypothetical protein
MNIFQLIPHISSIEAVIQLPSYLDEFQWRQLYGKKTLAAFDNILQQISVFYPVNN